MPVALPYRSVEEQAKVFTLKKTQEHSLEIQQTLRRHLLEPAEFKHYKVPEKVTSPGESSTTVVYKQELFETGGEEIEWVVGTEFGG